MLNELELFKAEVEQNALKDFPVGLFSGSSLRLSFLSRSLQFVLSLRCHSLPFVLYSAGTAQHNISPPALCFAGSSCTHSIMKCPLSVLAVFLSACWRHEFCLKLFFSNVPTVVLFAVCSLSRSALTSSPTLYANTCAHVPFGSNKVGCSFIAQASCRNAGPQLRCCSPAVAQRKPDQEAVQTQAANMMQAESSSSAQAHILTFCFSSFSICENIWAHVANSPRCWSQNGAHSRVSVRCVFREERLYQWFPYVHAFVLHTC